MPKLTQKDLRDFAFAIKNNIDQEFSNKYLTHNLVDTVQIVEGQDNIQVTIPAKIYNFYQYFKHGGVIIYRGGGSYASQLDRYGSEFVYYPETGGRVFIKPHNHIGYVDRVIDNSIVEWSSKILKKFNEMNITE